MKYSPILSAKVGYFLEQRKGAFYPSKTVMEAFLKLIPTSVQYISDKDKEKHKLIKKWNLMVPISVVNQTWDEPNYDV